MSDNQRIIAQARIDELNSIIDRIWEISDELNDFGIIDAGLIFEGVSRITRAALYAQENLEEDYLD